MKSAVKRDYPYAVIAEWILKHPGLNAQAIRVFCALDRHNPDPFPGLATIADWCHVSEDSVRRAVRRLERVGAVVVEQRFVDGRQTSNLYHLAGQTPLDPAEVLGRPGKNARGGVAKTRGTGVAPVPGEEREQEEREPTNEKTSTLASERDGAPGTEVAPRDEIGKLCELLAAKVGAHRGSPSPPVTQRWRRDMRLLVERGPLHQADPTPLAVDHVAGSIEFLFDRMAEPQGRDGFCWADQVRSPGALRDHWLQIRQSARRDRHREATPAGRVLDRVDRGEGDAVSVADLFARGRRTSSRVDAVGIEARSEEPGS